VSTDESVVRRASGTKVAHHTMREVNRSIVLDILREGRPVSRVELSRRTGLSKPTVSSIIEDLVGGGLVREMGTEAATHRTGRPPSLLVYNERAVAFAGIQFGVNTTHVAIADGLGNLVATATTPAVHGDLDQSVRDAQKALREAAAGAGMKRDQLRGVGVAVPGLVDIETGRCIVAPNIGWRDAPVRHRIEAALRVPAMVANSTHAAAIAEARLSGADYASLVWVYAGSGIGAGIVVDGALFTGARGFAGEIGHAPAIDNGVRCSCGNRGCVETMAGTTAIARLATEAIERGAGATLSAYRGQVTAEVVARLADAGNPDALAVIGEAGDHLGRAIAYVIDVLSPTAIVLGGPLAMMSGAYVDAVRASVARHALPVEPVPVQLTALGPHAPLLGVVQLAMGRATPSYRVVS
jgi:predicted NBD/HSP70 family sugar kinase/DNA-binding transcriptional ArsR family regulator